MNTYRKIARCMYLKKNTPGKVYAALRESP
jgi:hypothetical protein